MPNPNGRRFEKLTGGKLSDGIAKKIHNLSGTSVFPLTATVEPLNWPTKYACPQMKQCAGCYDFQKNMLSGSSAQSRAGRSRERNQLMTSPSSNAMKELSPRSPPIWKRLLAYLFMMLCVPMVLDSYLISVRAVRMPHTTPKYRQYQMANRSSTTTTRPFDGTMFEYDYSSVWQVPSTYLGMAFFLLGSATMALEVRSK